MNAVLFLSKDELRVLAYLMMTFSEAHLELTKKAFETKNEELVAMLSHKAIYDFCSVLEKVTAAASDLLPPHPPDRSFAV